MIWLSIFFFFFLELKNFMFLSSLFELDSVNLFMSMICPLILFLIFSLNNSLLGCFEGLLFCVLFFMIVFFVFFCFLFNSIYYFIFSLEMCIVPMIFLIFTYSKSLDKIISVFFMFFFSILGSLPFMIFFSSHYLSFFFSFSFFNFFLVYSNNVIFFFFFF